MPQDPYTESLKSLPLDVPFAERLDHNPDAYRRFAVYERCISALLQRLSFAENEETAGELREIALKRSIHAEAFTTQAEAITAS